MGTGGTPTPAGHGIAYNGAVPNDRVLHRAVARGGRGGAGGEAVAPIVQGQRQQGVLPGEEGTIECFGPFHSTSSKRCLSTESDASSKSKGSGDASRSKTSEEGSAVAFWDQLR